MAATISKVALFGALLALFPAARADCSETCCGLIDENASLSDAMGLVVADGTDDGFFCVDDPSQGHAGCLDSGVTSSINGGTAWCTVAQNGNAYANIYGSGPTVSGSGVGSSGCYSRDSIVAAMGCITSGCGDTDNNEVNGRTEVTYNALTTPLMISGTQDGHVADWSLGSCS